MGYKLKALLTRLDESTMSRLLPLGDHCVCAGPGHGHEPEVQGRWATGCGDAAGISRRLMSLSS
jgi:hypothetical protein